MQAYLNQYFNHVLFAMLLFARSGDILTTWLATPKLRHEANPLAKKLGWWFAIATIFLSLAAYVSEPLALSLLSISLCVCASNAGKVWFMRTLGEEEYHALLVSVMQRSTLGKALFFNCLPAVFYLLLGSMIQLVEVNSTTRAFYLGTGILAYGLAIVVFFPWRYYRLYVTSREAAR